MQPQSLRGRLQLVRKAAVSSRFRRKFVRFFADRRVIRYGLFIINLALLLGIGAFILRGTEKGQPLGKNAVMTAVNSESAAAPLDQVSSADIAANVSLAAGLPETTAVINQADSAQADLAVAPADNTVVAKPQAVATALKSRKDIQEYTVQSGDTVSSIASKFNVTSDSVMWSNNLKGNLVNEGTKLHIPPVNGIVYTVLSNDTLDSIATKYKANKAQLVAFNDAEISGIQTGEQILIPNGQQPVAATVVLASAFTASYGGNGYDYGFCTWYVATQVAVPSNWGNASTWAYYAALSGWTVSSTPKVGAIAQTPYAAGGEGHVAVVDEVSDDGAQIKIRDMNGIAGFGRVGYSDWISTSTYPHYIYH